MPKKKVVKRGRPPHKLAKVITKDTPRAEIERWMRERLKGGLMGYMQKLYSEIDAVDKPELKARLLMELLTFLAPKLKAMEVTGQVDATQPINIVFAQATPTEKIAHTPVEQITETIIEAEELEDSEEEE